MVGCEAHLLPHCIISVDIANNGTLRLHDQCLPCSYSPRSPRARPKPDAPKALPQQCTVSFADLADPSDAGVASPRPVHGDLAGSSDAGVVSPRHEPAPAHGDLAGPSHAGPAGPRHEPAAVHGDLSHARAPQRVVLVCDCFCAAPFAGLVCVGLAALPSRRGSCGRPGRAVVKCVGVLCVIWVAMFCCRVFVEPVRSLAAPVPLGRHRCGA